MTDASRRNLLDVTIDHVFERSGDVASTQCDLKEKRGKHERRSFGRGRDQRGGHGAGSRRSSPGSRRAQPSASASTAADARASNIPSPSRSSPTRATISSRRTGRGSSSMRRHCRFCLGARIDFVDDLMGQAFKIENPNASRFLRLRRQLLGLSAGSSRTCNRGLVTITGWWFRLEKRV